MGVVKFVSLGGVREIGASAHLIEMGGIKVLLDCGLHPKKEGLAALPDFSVLEGAPDAVIITHAHVDHCGSLPYLTSRFPSTIPYATAPTLQIMDRMLHNSVSVMGRIKDEQGIEAYPLYEHEDVDTALRKAYSIGMEQEFALTPSSPLRATFYPAGHVLGSASVKLSTPDHTLFYTSDICTIDQELMGAFSVPSELDSPDTLVVESTYGANGEADDIVYRDEITRFGRAIAQVIERGGTVLVPSFALGRAQEILNMVARLQEEGMIPDVPIYASGLGRAVYEIYRRFDDQLRPDAYVRPLDQFLPVGDVWNPKVVRRLLKSPGIIVATSGMMIENTPSAMIAEHLIQHEHHGIFFVGYCDPETLGHRVKNAQIGDRLVFSTAAPPVKVVLENIEWYHFSAHAHRRGLQDVVKAMKARNIVFVHGDEPAVEWMHENCGDGSTKFAPRIGEPIELTG